MKLDEAIESVVIGEDPKRVSKNLFETTKIGDHLENVKLHIQDFENLQRKHIDYGARDTEPREEFHAIVRRAVTGEPFGEPRWELFSRKPGNGRASRELTSQARKVHSAVSKAVLSKQKHDVRDFLKKHMDWDDYDMQKMDY